MYKLIVVLALAVCAQAHSARVAFPEAVQHAGSRIIHGSLALPAQFPYHAFLILAKLNGDKFACGGSLISPTWVLTAGNCVSGYVSAEVYLGSIEWSESPVKVRSTHLVLHPDFSGARSDIGLIALPAPVSLNINIQTIALPNDPDTTYSGREATITGFGITQQGGDVSPVLRYAPVRIITNVVCRTTYPTTVRDSILCARGVETGEQGFCDGDYGGPLVLVENGVLKQVGIASFISSKGCNSDNPRGYTRPYHFLRWISIITGLKLE